MAVSSVRIDEGTGPYLHAWERSVSSVNRREQYVQLGEPALPTYTAVFDAISIATIDDHVVQITAPASSYIRVHRIVLWQYADSGTAAAHRFEVRRITTAGSGGSWVTPRPFDTADTAGATVMTLPSPKGSEAAGVLLPIVIVLRQNILTTASQNEAPFVWEASARGKPIVIPAGTANGIVIKNIAARASASVSGYIEFTETSFL